jgi:hypothetical protein
VSTAPSTSPPASSQATATPPAPSPPAGGAT